MDTTQRLTNEYVGDLLVKEISAEVYLIEEKGAFG